MSLSCCRGSFTIATALAMSPKIFKAYGLREICRHTQCPLRCPAARASGAGVCVLEEPLRYDPHSTPVPPRYYSDCHSQPSGLVIHVRESRCHGVKIRFIGAEFGVFVANQFSTHGNAPSCIEKIEVSLRLPVELRGGRWSPRTVAHAR